eukprot:COSAG01_NODE_24952_length_760_cov_2.440242_1_plen_64_part_01
MPVDLVEQDIAASYEVGCVLEELLRCVDALDERDRHIPKVGPLPLLDHGVEVLTAVSPHELWLV